MSTGGGSVQFERFAGLLASRIITYSGGEWALLQPRGGFNDRVMVVQEYEGEIYAGGVFSYAGEVPVRSLARWDGVGWSDVGGGVTGSVYPPLRPSISAMEVYDDGGGAALYMGGRFLGAGGSAAANLARWDGVTLTPVEGLAPDTSVRVLFDGAMLPAPHSQGLYMGGTFREAGGTIVNSLARFDGVQWHSVGGGVEFNGARGHISALCVHDDGTGAAIYAGGTFWRAGQVPANGVARWDGETWMPLGDGLLYVSPTMGTMYGMAYSLAGFDDGSGRALYVGGSFTHAGGVVSPYLARWRGGIWEPVESPLTGGAGRMAAFDDGQREVLVVAGYSDLGRLLTWDGNEWTPLEVYRPHGSVSSMFVRDRPGRAQSLFLAGEFMHVGGQEAGSLAEWRGCPRCPPDCDNSGSLDVDDFVCFIGEFTRASLLSSPAQATHWANCDHSTTAPVLNVDDFTCFINEFIAGCP